MKNIIKRLIPYFEDASTALMPGLPVIERSAINAIVYHKTSNKVLCLDWKEFGWKTFIIGGIEKGEDPITAARRETFEETGYKDIQLLSMIGETRSGYYAAHKKENRISNATALLFELRTDNLGDIQDSLKLPHIFTWIPRELVFSYVTPSSQKYIWKKADEVLCKRDLTERKRASGMWLSKKPRSVEEGKDSYLELKLRVK